MGQFAGRLRELREARGLSQAQLAEVAGMHRFGVAKLEQGVREPAWATVIALAAALGCTPNDFLPPPPRFQRRTGGKTPRASH